MAWRQRSAGARGKGAMCWFSLEEKKKRQEQRQERKRGQVGLPLAASRLLLLRTNSHLLEHDALGVRRPSERLFPLGAEVRLLVVLVGPQLRAAVRLELAPGSQTTRLAAMTMVD